MRRRGNPIGFMLGLAFTARFVWGATGADFDMEISPPTVQVASGAAANLSVLLTTRVDHVQGWSLGIILDPDQGVAASITAVALSADTLTIKNGALPDFFDVDCYDSDNAKLAHIQAPNTSISGVAAAGVTHRATIDFRSMQTLPDAREDLGLLDLTVAAMGPEGRGVRAAFSDAVGDPVIRPIVTHGSSSFYPAVQEGSVLTIGPEPMFKRGDSNGSGAIDVADVVFTLSYLFARGTSPGCLDAADANDSSIIDIADAITSLSHLFARAGPLPRPFGSCGNDPTSDGLNCRAFSPCYTETKIVFLPGSVPLEMVWCPPGHFLMGAYDGEQGGTPMQRPQHRVTLSSGFWLGKYEVTKRQWLAVMGTIPWAGKAEVLNDPESPAVYVSWDHARVFMTSLNNLGQGTFGLPSEAEWEFACRAGTETRFFWGDDPDQTKIGAYAWYYGNCSPAQRYDHVVGRKLPNAWGFFDMSGNAEEWCEDAWHGTYDGAPTDGTAWVTGGLPGTHVVRGGSWNINAAGCRSAYRNGYVPSDTLDVGFRVAMWPAAKR